MATQVTDELNPDQTRKQPVNPAVPGADPEGYDYGKFMDAWYHSAPGTNLDNFISSNKGFTQGATTSKNGEMLNLPGGESFDAVRDFGPGGANAPQWGSSGYDYASGRALSPQESAAAEASWAAKNGVSSGGGGGSSTTVSATAGSPYGRYSDEIYKQIMGLLDKGNKPVTEEDVAGQYAPVARTLERGAEQTRRAAAERGAYSGTNLGGAGGALDADVNSINEQLTEKKGNTMADLMSKELTARRQQVTDALQFAQGEEKTALQLQLAQIDKDLRQQSLALTSKGQDQQNMQFYDRLGFDMGNEANNLDSQLLAALLGGS